MCCESNRGKRRDVERERELTKRIVATRKRDHVPIALFIVVYRVSITFMLVRLYVFVAFADVLLL